MNQRATVNQHRVEFVLMIDSRRSTARPQYIQSRPLRPPPLDNSKGRMFTGSFRRELRRRARAARDDFSVREKSTTDNHASDPNIDPLCTKCGYRKHDNVFRCPAITKHCIGCSKIGHFRSVSLG